jgi:sulfite exporter TauE/SafE
MTELGLIFLAGVAGSMHCIGMCGGFACALGPARAGGAATLLRHLSFNVGRATTYIFIGALAGQFGAVLVGHAGADAGGLAQRMLALLAGTMMVIVGLQLFGLLGHARHPLAGVGASWLAQSLRSLLRAPGLGAPLALGVLNGFLPCPLVYAFAAYAAASGAAWPGMQVMAAFGLGTFPAMLAMGGAGLWWRRRAARAGEHAPTPAGLVPLLPAGALRAGWRTQGVRLAGAFIVLLGAITLLRGLLPLAAHLH